MAVATSLYPPLAPSQFNSLPVDGVAEPEFDAPTLGTLDQLRSLILARVESSGLTYTPDFNTGVLPDCHWRDIYHEHRHLTAVEVAPDPRPLTDFSEQEYSPSTNPATWSNALLNHFLVARRGDAIGAAKMFANYLAWRRRFGVDDLARQRPMPFDDVIESIIAHAIHKRDTEGSPIYLQRTGLIDPQQFTARVPDPVLVLSHTHFMERAMASLHTASVDTGKRVDKLVNAIDTTGVTLGHARTVKFFRLTTFIDQNFYPETLKSFNFCHAPAFLPSLVAMAKPFLDPKTFGKLHVLPTSDLNQLVERCGRENLPAEFGGSCQCVGGCLPTTRQRQESIERCVQQIAAVTLAENIITESVAVAAGKTSTISFDVTNGKHLWIEASIGSKDAVISVKFCSQSNPALHYLIVQPIKVEAGVNESKARAMFEFSTACNTGRATIDIDNSYSRFTGKDVTVKYAVLSTAGSD